MFLVPSVHGFLFFLMAIAIFRFLFLLFIFFEAIIVVIEFILLITPSLGMLVATFFVRLGLLLRRVMRTFHVEVPNSIVAAAARNKETADVCVFFPNVGLVVILLLPFDRRVSITSRLAMLVYRSRSLTLTLWTKASLVLYKILVNMFVYTSIKVQPWIRTLFHTAALIFLILGKLLLYQLLSFISMVKASTSAIKSRLSVLGSISLVLTESHHRSTVGNLTDSTFLG
jgi:hypothetical protein